MTNVPSPTFGPTGFVVPDESVILAGVQADLNAAFGGNLNPALETPQGQIATTETAIIGDKNDTFLDLTNQVNPDFADGRMQDAIARFYDIDRNPAEPTSVQVTCGGGAGVVIPVGSLVVDASSNIYASTEAGTIPAGGSIILSFACTTNGPIACPVGAISAIYQAIPGWDTAINETDGIPGRDVETRADFEIRRQASLQKNAVGSLPAVLGSVLAVPGVLDAYATENTFSVPLTVRGFLLAPKSLYVAAVGGSAGAIAAAIWKKKAPGCAYNGNVTVTIEDQTPPYTPPYPSYAVKFEIPNSLPILFSVVLSNNPGVPADGATQVKNAIISAFNGGDGGARARIASTLYATRYIGPVFAIGNWAQVRTLHIGSDNAASADFTASSAGTTLTVSAIGAGAIAAGQTLIGLGVPAGTTIIALGTGTGGVGTYIISQALTLSSRAMSTAIADGDTVIVDIDQAPTINADNIAVTFA